MKNFKISDAVSLYGLDNWSGGYFDINKDGNLSIRPGRDDIRSVDLKEIVDELTRRKISFPVNVRFGQILADRVRYISNCFNNAISEFEYEGEYLGVFPMKVNHRREIVEELIRSGREFSLGIEVGSKPELTAALTFNLKKKSLIICNGFKDKTYLEMAICGKRLGHKIVLVIERLSEFLMLQ